MRKVRAPILITGFMAAGKTTVARALARLLHRSMLDLDQAIVERGGRNIPAIISEEGEAGFRVAETHALDDALREERASVIALGGGTWTLERNRALIEKHQALVVWLDAPFELCWRRIVNANDEERPLAPDRTTARLLYDERLSLYKLAHLRVEVSEETTAQAIAAEIAAAIRIEDERKL